MNCRPTSIHTFALTCSIALTAAACQERSSGTTGGFWKSAEPQPNHQLIWIDGGRPSKFYRELVEALTMADEHGLPAERVRAIELNMERWRWLPDVMPD